MNDINCSPSVEKTLKHEMVHLAVSIGVALFVQVTYFDTMLSVFTLALAMLLDADHLFDYALYLYKSEGGIFGLSKFSIKEFLSGAYFQKWQKFITPLHAWEIAIASLLLYFFWLPYPIFMSIALALSSHYLVDYFTNNVNKKAYFITYRAKNGFVKKAIAS